MPVTRLFDEGGAPLKVLDIDGYYLPTFSIENHEQHVRSIPQWKSCDDDVMICAYPKAGTHWIWEVVSMLLHQTSDRVKFNKETAMLEGLTQHIYDGLSSPRVLNTHLYSNYLPVDFLKRKCKIVYILRNPKDLAVSFFNHHSKLVDYEFHGKWEHYIKRFIDGDVDYGSWFDYVKHWESFEQENPEYPYHVIHYEEMKRNGVEEIRRLASFLNIEADEDLIQAIDENCQFDKMKQDKEKNENSMEWKNNRPEMYRKGQVGDWKNWFTVNQNEYFDNEFSERMQSSRVKVIYSLK